jgi:hypothetical protein
MPKRLVAKKSKNKAPLGGSSRERKSLLGRNQQLVPTQIEFFLKASGRIAIEIRLPFAD